MVVTGAIASLLKYAVGTCERQVLRVLAANRNPGSFIGGATVLHQAADSPRRSQDVDVFHDAPELLLAAY